MNKTIRILTALAALLLLGVTAVAFASCDKNPDTSADTTAEATPAPTEDPTDTPTDTPDETQPEKKGCKSAVGLTALLTVVGAAWVIRKKRED